MKEFKFTKKGRLEIYKNALIEFETRTGRHLGFCDYFLSHLDIDVHGDAEEMNNDRYNNPFKSTFPELYDQRETDEDDAYHYDYWDEEGNRLGPDAIKLKRANALKKAISILENQ